MVLQRNERGNTVLSKPGNNHSGKPRSALAILRTGRCLAYGLVVFCLSSVFDFSVMGFSVSAVPCPQPF